MITPFLGLSIAQKAENEKQEVTEMYANYHTHSYRCFHATEDRDEAYVQAAIASGLKILGFSDHTPYPFPDGYYSSMRMYPNQLGEYCETILGLKEKYKDSIDIRLGLETEYYPAYFSEYLSIIRDCPVEYLLLGQHWINNEIGESYCGRITGNPMHLQRYCDQVIEAMQTGVFTYLAHPDLIHFIGSDQLYREHMRRVCREAKACNIPLEINLLGLEADRHYPDLRFWEIAAEENCTVILGRDAHDPNSFLNTRSVETAMEIVHKYSLPLLETVDFRPIR